MIYNISDLVTYARSRDARLLDTITYPDSKMEAMLEEAFAVAQDIRPLFATVETYDLEANIVEDELKEVELILQREPQSIRAIVDYNDFFFNYEITANNHIIMRVTDETVRPDDGNYSVTIKYFYYPLMPMTQIELSVDGYRLVKEAMGAVVCAELRDYAQEKYHKDKAKLMAQESPYDLEKNTLDFPETLIEDGTWV